MLSKENSEPEGQTESCVKGQCIGALARSSSPWVEGMRGGHPDQQVHAKSRNRTWELTAVEAGAGLRSQFLSPECIFPCLKPSQESPFQLIKI